MPRTRRLIPADAAMDITCRGNNKQNIFYGGKDKLYYLSLLRKLKNENRIIIYHYCLMNNHVHLIVQLSAQSTLSRFMKQVNLSYFNYYKKNYAYCGHLWQGRFKSNIINTNSYLLQCGKYIELNPVRAGIVSSPEEYRFSSYNFYTKGRYDSILAPDPAFLGLSTSIEARRTHYIEFVVDSSLINTEKLKSNRKIEPSPFSSYYIYLKGKEV